MRNKKRKLSDEFGKTPSKKRQHKYIKCDQDEVESMPEELMWSVLEKLNANMTKEDFPVEEIKVRNLLPFFNRY